MLSLSLVQGPCGPSWRIEADLHEEAEHFLAICRQAGEARQTVEGRWVAWLQGNYFDHEGAGVFPWTRIEISGADPATLAGAAAAWAQAQEVKARADIACAKARAELQDLRRRLEARLPLARAEPAHEGPDA